jgi:hypothetical protein
MSIPFHAMRAVEFKNAVIEINETPCSSGPFLPLLKLDRQKGNIYQVICI